MKLKKIMVWSLVISLSVIAPMPVMATEKKQETEFYDIKTGEYIAKEDLWQYLRALQESVQYGGKTTGTATSISWDDYLLDGNYENGELVNGDVYYSVEDAFQGYQKDLSDAQREDEGIQEMVYPDTGVIVGIDTDGDFWYTVHSSGRTAVTEIFDSETVVETESDIWRDIGDGSTLTSSDYSYIISLVDSSGTTVGSYRGYTDGIRGGQTYSTTPFKYYYVKIKTEDFPLSWYCHGSG